MASAELEFVNELLGTLSLGELTIPDQRLAMEQAASAPVEGTSLEAVDAGGVPAEWVAAPEITGAGVLLSLHGGAYSLGSLRTNRWLSSLLSAATGRRVLSIDYRLAPEHRFPAAIDDALAAYRWLLDQDIPGSDIVIVGDSAGGGLALGALVALRDSGVALPGAAIGLSPWTDLTALGASVGECASTDLLLDADGLAGSAALYAVPSEFAHPHVSPVFADLRGLPPILLQASRAEVLRDDTTRFVERASEHGVEVTAQLYDDMPHVWHTFAGLLPEADQAIEAIGRWVAALEERPPT